MENEVKTPAHIILFPNGGTACFDEDGNQIPELQKGWLIIWLEWLEKQGVKIEEIEKIETIINRTIELRPFKTKHGWNCDVLNSK